MHAGPSVMGSLFLRLVREGLAQPAIRVFRFRCQACKPPPLLQAGGGQANASAYHLRLEGRGAP